jgi:taurine dioxygenase
VRTSPLSAACGVVVDDLDLAGDLTPYEDELRALLYEHQMLCFRVPDLPGEDQQRLLACFGPLVDESFDGSGWSYVSNVEPGGVLGDGPFLFHSDLEFTPEPLWVLSLYAVELPETPTSTRFANSARAAAHLDAHLASELDGLTALHAYPLLEGRGDARYRVRDLDDGAPRAEHPLLLTHPVTGAPVLYVTAMQTDSVVGLPEDESEDLLGRLWADLYAPDNVYEHEWQLGDLLVWDNLSLQHARGAVTGRRTLRRVPVGTVLARLRSPGNQTY